MSKFKEISKSVNTIQELQEQSEKELRDNILFGKETDLAIHRWRNDRVSVHIGDKELIGVRKIQLTVEGGKELKYKIEGEVV